MVIVREDDSRGIHRERLLDDLARVNGRPIDGATKEFIESEYPVAIVEIQATKELVIEVLHASFEKRLGVSRTPNGLTHRQRFGEVTACQLG